MSYVITSNKTDDDDLENYASENSRPFNYSNTLSNTIVIPKNGQVALQSAKINLDGSISIGNAARIFYFYFGQHIDMPPSDLDAFGFPAGASDQTGSGIPSVIPDINSSTAKPIRIELFDDFKDKGIDRVSTNELSLELERCLNTQTYHPQLAGRWKVTPKLNTNTKAFEGFNILCNQGLTAPGTLPLTNYVPPTQRAFSDGGKSGGMIDAVIWDQRLESNAGDREWTYASIGGVGGFTYGTAGRSRKTAAVIGNVPPLSNKAGHYRVEIKAALGRNNDSSSFMVGLTRALNGEPFVTTEDGNYCNPSYYDNRYGGRGDAPGQMKNLIDYCISVDARDGILKVFQAVADSTIRDAAKAAGELDLEEYERLYMKQFAYAEVGQVAGIDPLPSDYDINTNNLDIDHINFYVDGEVVTIQAEDSDTTTFYDIVRYDSTRNKIQNLKPVNQSCWSLYPYLAGNNFFDDPGPGYPLITLKIKKFTGIDGTALQTQHRFWYEKDDLSFADHRWSWEQQMIANGQIPQIEEVDQRIIVDIGQFPGVPLGVTYTSIDSNTSPFEYRLGYAGDIGTGNTPHLILSEDSRYPESNGANAQQLLGYDRIPVVDYNYFELNADGKGWTTGSATLPNGVSTRSIFVRVNNLTQKSLNAFKDIKSGIIGHLPRFDGLNNVGPLYLEPKNLVYVDIDNPAPITLNELSISLVYSDETYCEALSGTTIVCLHIKEKGT